jgi:hypothetical protein
MFTHANRRGCQSIFAPRVVRELRVEPPTVTVADGVPATPIVEPCAKARRKAVYLPGERLLKKLNKDRDKKKSKKLKVINQWDVIPRPSMLNEDDVERLAGSVTSVLASLNI